MELIPKAKVTSPIWAHYGFVADENGKAVDEMKPTCKLCRVTVSASGGNTSNLTFHLRKHHPLAYSQLQPTKRKRDDSAGESSDRPTKQPKITQTLQKGQLYKKSSTRFRQLTKGVTKYIAGAMVPIYTVDNSHFKGMIAQFDSRYQLPGRKYFTETAIPELYNEIRDRVLTDVKTADYYSCTCDLWSSEGMVPYLGLTIHFVDADWKLQSRILETLYFPDDHTADNIGETLKDCLANWGLDSSKLVSMTTDNGANIKKALRDLEWSNLSCFGHNLHLAINKSLTDQRIIRALGRCRTIVSTFSTSWKKRRQMKEAQESLKLPQHQLITDCQTRWGSKFAMVKRIVEQEPALRRVLSNDKKTAHLALSWQDTQVLEAISAALETVGDFTDILSQEQYVSVSALKPLVKLLATEILETSKDEHSLTSHIKDIIKGDMENRYNSQGDSISALLSMSSFLDPKFKCKYLSECDVSEVKKRIVDQTGSPIDLVKTTPDQTTPTKKTLSSLFSKAKSIDVSSSKSSPIENEIYSYLGSFEPDEDSNVLNWWKLHEKSFPNIAKLARKYLCVTATSCPSERLFSKSGQIVTPKRACLKPDRVNQLSFLSCNLSHY